MSRRNNWRRCDRRRGRGRDEGRATAHSRRRRAGESHQTNLKRADGQPTGKASRRKDVALGKNAVAARDGGRLNPRQEVRGVSRGGCSSSRRWPQGGRW